MSQQSAITMMEKWSHLHRALCRASAAIVLVLIPKWALGAAPNPSTHALAFQVARQTICIASAKPAGPRQCDHTVAVKSLDYATRRMLSRADDVVPVFAQPAGDRQYLVFIARVPSRTPPGTGYCGAGYEDHLVLLDYAEKKIALRDDFLLQSCLQSIALDSDGDENILTALAIDVDRQTIKFRWLTNPDTNEHILRIAHGKFELTESKAPSTGAANRQR